MYIYGLFGSLLAQMWTTAKMPLLYAGHMRNVGRPELEYKSTVAHIRASFALFGWLTCGNAKVYSRPKSGKQDQTAQRPNLGQNYNKCVAYLSQICFILFMYCHGWHAAFLWLACGPNQANRSGPPERHRSTRCGPDLGLGNSIDIWDGPARWLCFSFFLRTQMNLKFSVTISYR